MTDKYRLVKRRGADGRSYSELIYNGGTIIFNGVVNNIGEAIAILEADNISIPVSHKKEKMLESISAGEILK